MNQLLDIYKKFPVGLKNYIKYGYSFIPLRMRLGNKFFKQLDFLNKSQWWSAQELENYQNEQLHKLIKHAYENVPYYNLLLKKHTLMPGDIKTIKDLQKLPILTKEDVRNNTHLLRARNFRDNQVAKLFTSGTAGKPLLFYYDKNKEYLNFDPFVWRFFGWAGHSLGELRATLSGWTTENREYIYNPVRNLLILSAYKINAGTALMFAKALAEYPIRYLDGYPSMIELLTRYLEDNGIKRPTSLNAIFCHSEYLYEWQRSSIESYWGCKCFDWYALEERVVLGIECEQHEGLHLCSDFGVTEFIDAGNQSNRSIIATSLTNYAMPLIRYDTGDYGVLLEKKCSCKRSFPLFELHGGRTRNFAITKDNSYISVTNIDIPNVTENIWQFQFLQEKKGSLVLKIVKKDSFTEDDFMKVKNKLNEKFGKNMDVDIEFTDFLPQTSSEKTLIFIQNIKEGFSEPSLVRNV